MRVFTGPLLALILGCIAGLFPRPVARAPIVYLAKIHDCWCSFSKKALYESAVAKSGSTEVAKVVYSGGSVETIALTQEAESGDWVVYDVYTMGFAGQPDMLRREIRFAEGDRRVRELYVIKGGQAQLQKMTKIDPSTGKAIAGPITWWLPAPPVATTLASFQFHDLIGDMSPESNQKQCMPITDK